MDLFEKSLRDQDHHHQRRSNSRRDKNPSFSSTLLDAIYRSIDESNGTQGGVDEELIYRETMRRKQGAEMDSSSMRRACMIEEWIEKKVSFENKVVVRRKSMEDSSHNNNPAAVLLNSSSSSSESSCGGGFSSSESDSIYGSKSRSSSCYSMQRPRHIRTSISSSASAAVERKNSTQKQQPKSEGGFVRTKSKALKIYRDLKKVKQPISPGGRLATFINSLFTAGNAKKAKISKLEQPEPESTCSSASSFSRSCLSKTPSSRGKSSNNGGAKRSVRFYPAVSVIVDEDCRPYEPKTAANYHHIVNEELQCRMKSESQRIEEAARELLKNYQKNKKKKEEFDQMGSICMNDNEVSYDDDVDVDVNEDEDEDDDDDDAASYASSDLFELDNLSAIGIERYREELPVYETTHVDTNRAIANGLIL